MNDTARSSGSTEPHPSTVALLKWFRYGHLPQPIQSVSRPFLVLAMELIEDHGLTGPELTVALRKLLEAKDCAVRAALEKEVTSVG